MATEYMGFRISKRKDTPRFDLNGYPDGYLPGGWQARRKRDRKAGRSLATIGVMVVYETEAEIKAAIREFVLAEENDFAGY